MKMIENKKGVSLIVLVITIIVIIILAVAVILSIANNNPIENAKKAKDAQNKSTLEEAANLAYADWYTNIKLNRITDEPQKYVEEKLRIQGFYEEDIDKIYATDKGISVVTVPDGFVHVSIEDDMGNQTSTATTGYVIKNVNDNNEFVWIPVNDISEFKREVFDTNTNYNNCMEPYKNTGSYESEEVEYNKMFESVKKYHGFYIARYEASKNSDTNKAQSIQDATPWSGAIWGNSMTDPTGGAVEAARAVYPETDAIIGGAVSTLCYGVEWDHTVRFILKNYPGIASNATGCGNYIGYLVRTGSNKNYAQNNIYDMCGNAEEWTMESYANKVRILRGARCTENPVNHTLIYRGNNFPSQYGNTYGFRIALYIK